MYSSRVHRLRVKNLHNFKSQKSRIDLWGVKLQHKARSILARGEIFENSSQTERICKGMLMFTFHAFANPLRLAYIFENFVPNKDTSDFML